MIIEWIEFFAFPMTLCPRQSFFVISIFQDGIEAQYQSNHLGHFKLVISLSASHLRSRRHFHLMRMKL